MHSYVEQMMKCLMKQVFDEDIGDDKRLGVAKLPLIELESRRYKQIELRLLPSLDMLKIKDKKDRGSLTVEVTYHEFSKEEQLKALEEEKRMIEQRHKLKEEGALESTMDAVDETVSGVGAAVGAGAAHVGGGFAAVGSSLHKAGKFMGRTIAAHTGGNKKSGATTPVNSIQENGGAQPRPT